ncbi:MAG: biopolymer transporter ExbD [Myxococcales bacterium]|nr:biopolymer transporter ExbD [Myxococcales bacterium]
MPFVHKPGKRLVVNAPLKFVRERAKGHGRSSGYADLNVTPMVDMLTMLVIFLLQTFSASGEILTISKDITMPKAFNATPLEPAPIIAISMAKIAFQGQFVMDSTGINNEKFIDFVLPPLKERLERNRDQWRLHNPSKSFDGQIIIQSDNSVNFAVIKMIMMTCAQAEYTSMNFAVLRTGRGDAAVGEVPPGGAAAPEGGEAPAGGG